MGQDASQPIVESFDGVVESLLVRMRPTMERILWHYQIPPQDTEDLVQEILLTFVRRHQAIENPEAWMTSALKYQCLLFWRRRRRRLYKAVDDTLLDAFTDPKSSPAETVGMAHDLERGLRDLPERCREVLRLRYRLGLTPEELANEMGYQRSGISNIVRRCVGMLTQIVLGSDTGKEPRRA